VTPDPYDEALSALRDTTGNLATSLAWWSARSEPDARARRSASAAVDAIDSMLRELHQIRAGLIGGDPPIR
jgi:hypothetical protein